MDIKKCDFCKNIKLLIKIKKQLRNPKIMAKEKPLTLNGLAKYNQEVLFPFMEKTFVTKNEFGKFKNDMLEFKDDMLKFEDKALKDLADLKQEKLIGDEQNKRQKKVLKIHNNALKKNRILSEKDSLEINKLRVF